MLTLLLLPRPVLSGPEAIADSSDKAFRVHYTLQGVDALANGATDVSPMNGIPDDVDRVLDGAERVKAHWVDRAGMRAPLSDNGVGGSDAIDVYVRALGGPRGFTHPDDVGQSPAASAWIELEPATALEPTDGDSRLAAAAGHEAHHAIQYAYTTQAEPWIYEATAAYVEHSDFANSQLQAETDAHYAALLDHPETPLDTTDGSHEYDEMAFVRFYLDAFSEAALGSAWQTMADCGSFVCAFSAVGELRPVVYQFGWWLVEECPALDRYSTCERGVKARPGEPGGCRRAHAVAVHGVGIVPSLPSFTLAPLSLTFLGVPTSGCQAVDASYVSFSAPVSWGTDPCHGHVFDAESARLEGPDPSTLVLFASDTQTANVNLGLALVDVCESAPSGCSITGRRRDRIAASFLVMVISALAFRALRRGGRARP